MAVCEAIKRGNAALRARLAQEKAPIRPIYLKDEQKCKEPEKPYQILRPERLAKCTHERDSFLIERKPWDMTEHFRLHQKSRRDKRCPDDKFRVYHLIHPKPRRYKACKHHDNEVIDRDSLTPQEHLDMLARPMKREHPPQVYKLVPKFISPCTLRIKQLALPTKQLVLATWQQHAHHLPVGYIQNFRKTLHTTKFIETGEALEHIKQLKKDERQRRLSRKSEIRGLRKKLARKHEREMREVMQVIFDETKDMFLSGQPPRLTEDMTRMSEYVDKNLRKFIGECGCCLVLQDFTSIYRRFRSLRRCRKRAKVRPRKVPPKCHRQASLLGHELLASGWRLPRRLPTSICRRGRQF
jgi:hypothetical protein